MNHDVVCSLFDGPPGHIHDKIGAHGGDDSPGVGDSAPGEDERGYQGDEGHHQGHDEEKGRAGDGSADDLSARVAVPYLPGQDGEDHHQHVGKGEAPEPTHQRTLENLGHAGQEVDQAGDAEEGEAEPIDQGIDDFEYDEADDHDERHRRGEDVVDGGAEEVVAEKFYGPAQSAVDGFAKGFGVNAAFQHIRKQGIFGLLGFEDVSGRFHGCVDALVVEGPHTGEQQHGDNGPLDQPLRIDTGEVLDYEGNQKYPGQQPHEEEAVLLHESGSADGVDQKQIPDHRIHSL